METVQTRVRTRQTPTMAVCECCEKTFAVMKGSVGRYCSHDCMHQRRLDSRPPWMQCSKCLAEIGLGMTVQQRLLHTSKRAIHRLWKAEGIKAKVPDCGEWRRYAMREKSDVCGWWGNSETAALWMWQHRTRFPDWSSIWEKEKARRNATKYADSYQKMTTEEKKARNKASWIRRKNRMSKDDEFRLRMRDQINAWKERNPEKHLRSVRLSNKKRKLIDPGFRVQCNLRGRLSDLIKRAKGGGTAGANSLIGCSTKQLARHLESQFKRGMTWDNYGTKWHVDHILPCASFDHTDPRQVAQCWHWTNLRPLDAKKNMDKGASITEPQMSLLLCASH